MKQLLRLFFIVACNFAVLMSSVNQSDQPENSSCQKSKSGRSDLFARSSHVNDSISEQIISHSPFQMSKLFESYVPRKVVIREVWNNTYGSVSLFNNLDSSSFGTVWPKSHEVINHEIVTQQSFPTISAQGFSYENLLELSQQSQLKFILLDDPIKDDPVKVCFVKIMLSQAAFVKSIVVNRDPKTISIHNWPLHKCDRCSEWNMNLSVDAVNCSKYKRFLDKFNSNDRPLVVDLIVNEGRCEKLGNKEIISVLCKVRIESDKKGTKSL